MAKMSVLFLLFIGFLGFAMPIFATPVAISIPNLECGSAILRPTSPFHQYISSAKTNLVIEGSELSSIAAGRMFVSLEGSSRANTETLTDSLGVVRAKYVSVTNEIYNDGGDINSLDGRYSVFTVNECSAAQPSNTSAYCRTRCVVQWAGEPGR